MTTEDVKYVIDAEDKASAKLRRSKDEAKKLVGEVKNLGGQSKASAELVGTLASQVGNAGFGSAAGEVAQLIERVSAFSDVAKGGGKAALLFKGGVAAAAGVIAFKLGNAIGDIIFDTQRWKREMADATAQITENAGRLTNSISRGFSSQLTMIQSTVNSIERSDKLNDFFERAKKESTGAANNVERLRKKIKEMEADLVGFRGVGFQSENHKALIESTKAELENAKAILETRRSQQQQLQDMLSPAAKILKNAQARLAAQQKSDEVMKSLTHQLNLARATGEERVRLELKYSGVLEKDLERAMAFRELIQKQADDEKAKADAEKKAHDAKVARQKEFQRMQQEAAKQTAKMQEELQQRQLDMIQKRIDKIASIGSSIPNQPNVAENQRFGTGIVAAKFRQTAEAIEAKTQTTKLEAIRKLMERFVRMGGDKSKLNVNVLGN